MKVAIVGVGSVGETCAHALITTGIASELVLLNRTVELASAIERDLRQARAWRGSVATEVGPLASLDRSLNCDLVVIALGPRLWGDEQRDHAAKKSAKMLRESGLVQALRDLSEKLPPVLVVTNPVEPIVTWLWGQTGIARNKLFGLGTTVDTARYSLHLGSRFDASARSVWSMLVGEHGPGLIPTGASPLTGMIRDDEFKRASQSALRLTLTDAQRIRRLTEKVAEQRAKDQLLPELERALGLTFNPSQRAAAITVLAATIAPPGTRFSIAAAVCEVADAIRANENRILTVSSRPPSEWSFPSVALALPFLVGQHVVGPCTLDTPPPGLIDIANKIHGIAQTLP